MFFLVTGLYIALVSKLKNKLFLASFFLVFSFFAKDVFFAGILCLIPQIISDFKKLSSKLISVISGALLAVLLNISYLIRSNALESYIEVVRIKRLTFSTMPKLVIENVFMSFDKVFENYILISCWIAVVILLSILFIYRKSIRVNLVKNYKVIFTSGLLFLGMLLGYSIQGRFNNKYDIPLILPTILFVSALTNSFINRKRVAAIVLVIILLPSAPIINIQISRARSYNPFDHLQRIQGFETDEHLEIEKYIKSNTTVEDCIIKIYGWGVADAYIYSNRRPCSRHFLTNILPESMKQEYRQQLISNPPKAIIYSTYLSDTNIEKFENNVFNFTNVLDNCYYMDNIFMELYWSQFKINELSQCIETHSLPSSK